jgi:hypothetical protein
MSENKFDHILSRFTDRFSPCIDTYPGWDKIILELDEMLSYISPDYTVDQIKTKFAGLRYYANYVPRDNEPNQSVAHHIFSNLIYYYETISRNICEVCGDYGQKHSLNGWHFIACDLHKDQHPSRYLS